ncbi:MAG: SH3 domain-containing protein [Candidatus Acidiferrum sp.]
MKKRIAGVLGFLCCVLSLAAWAAVAHGQAVPYARSYAKPKEEVEQALKDLQAYTGQKLPMLDGFAAPGAKPLDRYERGFYQFSIELLPGDAGATLVRLSAKITAWYADRDVAKSGYEVLVSNGRLELDLLDRLQEKLTGKPVDPPATLQSNVQAPRPKLDLSGAPGANVSAPPPPATKTPDEVTTLRNQRVVEERRVQQLTAELQNLREIQHNQAHPQNLVAVVKPATPIFAKASENSRVLFQAAVNDEFEFLDAEGGWIHIEISGDSRGYVRQGAVLLPERFAAKASQGDRDLEGRFPGFRVEREEVGSFPGKWAPLKGKTVKIYTVQPVSQNSKESGPEVRLEYALALLEKGLKESASLTPSPEGVVVIFDAADGGIASATLADIRKYVSGSLRSEALWMKSYLDPIEAFRPPDN